MIKLNKIVLVRQHQPQQTNNYKTQNSKIDLSVTVATVTSLCQEEE